VQLGWNTIVGADSDKIVDTLTNIKKGVQDTGNPYGNGNASNDILQILKTNYL
jgi:UDP-N-acetylglucosamine 2-epimerase